MFFVAELILFATGAPPCRWGGVAHKPLLDAAGNVHCAHCHRRPRFTLGRTAWVR